MKIITSLLVLSLIISISFAQSESYVQFKVQDCSQGCEFSDDSNWVGGKAPTASQSALIDFSSSTYGPAKIIVSDPLHLSQLEIVNQNYTPLRFYVAYSGKIESLTITGNATAEFAQAITIVIGSKLSVNDYATLYLESTCSFIVDGSSVFSPLSTLTIQSAVSFVTSGNATFTGYISSSSNSIISVGGQNTTLAGNIYGAHILAKGNAIISPLTTANLVKVTLNLDASSTIVAEPNSKVLLNTTTLNGMNSIQMLEGSNLVVINSYVNTSVLVQKAQINVQGPNYFASVELSNGMMSVINGLMTIETDLIGSSGSNLYVVVDSLSETTYSVPIKVGNHMAFNGAVNVQTKSRALQPGVLYYVVESSTYINVPFDNCSFSPKQPGLTTNFVDTSANGSMYLVFSFESQ